MIKTTTAIIIFLLGTTTGCLLGSSATQFVYQVQDIPFLSFILKD